MKIGMLGFDQWHGKFEIGSSFLRIDCLLNYWPEAERFKQGGKYDVVIFQKAYWLEYMHAFQGIKILDLCDPDWLDIGSKIKECIDACDAVTTSSVALAEYIVKLTDKPVWCIPDRIDLEYFSKKKEHFGRAQSVVWFGYNHNFPVLDQALKIISDLELELIVISNKPFRPAPAFANKIEIINYPWSRETVNEDIIKGDICINPRLNSPKFNFKSSNKTLSSWALGMPVANNDTELKHFLDPENRKEEAVKRFAEILDKWTVQKSVEEYKQLIEELCISKNKTSTEQ